MTLRYRLVAPYPEGAIVQLGNVLAERDQLETIALSARATAPLARAAGRTGLVSDKIVHRLNRGVSGLKQARYLNPGWELIRMLSAAFSPKLGLPAVTFHQKKAFAKSAARIPGDFDVQVSLPVSLLDNALANPDAFNVFHAVDAHPAVHNQVLQEAFGEKARFEMLGQTEVDHLIEELAVCDAVLVPSQVVADGMIEHGVDSKKIIKVPYGVDLQTFSPVREPRDLHRGIEMVYVGQISYRKGIPQLLEAIRGTGIKLKMFGPLRTKKLLTDLPEEAEYFGIVPAAEVSQAMAQADAFVIASLEDAYAFVVTEALATGLPVIATDGVGAVESVPPEDCVVVAAGSVSELRSALLQVAPLSDDERNARADRIRASSDLVFGWPEFTSRALSAIEEKRAAR